MVKGVSKQVIVVNSPDKALFDQAIFILKDSAVRDGITDEALMKEAKQLIRNPGRMEWPGNPVAWACGGAATTGLLWLLTAIL